MVKSKVHPDYIEKLKETMVMLGWNIEDWIEFSGILEVVPHSTVKQALKGWLVREDYVYSVEWCIEDFLRRFESGEIAGSLGITYLNMGEFRVKVVDNKIIFEFKEKGSHSHLIEQLKSVFNKLNI